MSDAKKNFAAKIKDRINKVRTVIPNLSVLAWFKYNEYPYRLPHNKYILVYFDNLDRQFLFGRLFDYFDHTGPYDNQIELRFTKNNQVQEKHVLGLLSLTRSSRRPEALVSCYNLINLVLQMYQGQIQKVFQSNSNPQC